MKNFMEKHKNIIKNFTKKHKKVLIIILIIVSIPVIYTLARFIINRTTSGFLESKNFYFNSNRLKNDNPLYQINNWTGIGDFTIDITMSSEENNLLRSDFDIPYTIGYVCPNDVICTLSKPSGIIYTATHADTFTITLTPTRPFTDGESINLYVEATSVSPYIATISADFQIIVGKQGVSYSIIDRPNSPYLLVTVTNAIDYCRVIEAFGSYQVGDQISIQVFRNLPPGDRAKCVSISITLGFDPRIIVLDTTSPILRKSVIEEETINGVSYVNKITFPMDAMSSIEVRFYKLDHTQDYSYPFGVSIIDFHAE